MEDTDSNDVPASHSDAGATAAFTTSHTSDSSTSGTSGPTESANSSMPLITNPMDRWILVSKHQLMDSIKTEMSEYRLYSVTTKLASFWDDLCQWYIRDPLRSRMRGDKGPVEQEIVLTILYSTVYLQD